MSSTTRTRIWSAISGCPLFPAGTVAVIARGACATPEGRASRRLVDRPDGCRRRLFGRTGPSMTGGRTPYWSRRILSVTPVRTAKDRGRRLARRRVDEATATRESVSRGLAWLPDDLGLLGRDRQDHDLLLLVEGGRSGRGRGVPRPEPPRTAGGRGRQRGLRSPMPWRRTLVVSCRWGRTQAPGPNCVLLDRHELLLGEADDRVDVVTLLDDRADAADLVDSNGDRALSHRDLHIDDRTGEFDR